MDTHIGHVPAPLQQLLTIGIDTLTNGKYAFIDFTETLINMGIPDLFPWKQTVIEVLVTVHATPEMIRARSARQASGGKGGKATLTQKTFKASCAVEFAMARNNPSTFPPMRL